jgi:hypothetical protein
MCAVIGREAARDCMRTTLRHCWNSCVGAVLLLAVGCVSRAAVQGTPPAAPGPVAAPAGAAGPAVFRRLSRDEYSHSLRDLLGAKLLPADELGGDTLAGKSGFLVGGPVSGVEAGHLMEVSERVAGEAVAHLQDFVPCAPLPTDNVVEEGRCARQFIARFGRRAYRRPLTLGETHGLVGLYEQQRSEVGHDFAGAIRVVITAIVLSPHFLYRWDLAPEGAAGAVIRLDPYELASRLSYLLWASMPDDALLAAADGNRLATPEQIEAQSRRMLKDPKARDGMSAFFLHWLDVTYLPDKSKSSRVYRGYGRKLAQAMLDETAEFVSRVVLDGDGRIDTLLTSRESVIAPNLGKLYEVEVEGEGPQPATLDPTERAGILTQASFLAAHATSDQSHPVKRGITVLDRVLCINLPLPDDMVPDPKPARADLSTRDRFAEHGTNACAKDCHDLIDPLGFAFEHYNAVGAYRTSDGGKPVDATGSITLDGVEKKFENAVDLIPFLAKSREVRDCMARQWLRYALRRKEVGADEPSLAGAQEIFARTSSLRELLVAIAKSHAFGHRALSPGER